VQTLVNSLAGAQRYVVERELGHGGMGAVYQVLDLERNTRVALKALNKIVSSARGPQPSEPRLAARALLRE
jgi:serine/threonine protein kinase